MYNDYQMFSTNLVTNKQKHRSYTTIILNFHCAACKYRTVALLTCLIVLWVHCGVAIARSLTRRERVPRWRSPWQLANERGGSCAAPVRESVHPVYRVLARERLDASLAPPNWQRAGRCRATGGSRWRTGRGRGRGRKAQGTCSIMAKKRPSRTEQNRSRSRSWTRRAAKVQWKGQGVVSGGGEG